MYDSTLLTLKMTDTALCRVCLESDAKMQQIADTRYQEIFEKLSTKLCTEDRRPETVCYICFAHLQRCQRLVDMSRRAEEILTQLSLKGIQATPEAVTEMKLSMKQTLSVTPMQYLHISDAHDSSHVTVKEEVISVKDEGTAEEEPLVESVTENVLSSERYISECLKFESDSDHDHCNEPPSTMVEPTSTGEKPYTCDICGKQFTQKCHHTTHMRVHTGEKPYTCNNCGKQFNLKSNHTAHMRIHTGQKPYTCEICDKQFIHKWYHTIHMRVHTGEKPYTCDICGKQFTQKCHHTTHMRVHTREKPYTCDICDKQFYIKSSHAAHMSVHTCEKPYTCDICGKQFTQKCHHTTHMRVHTGEKPYSCEICDKQFNHKSNHTKHMRVHTGEKPYTCDICDKQFNQKCHRTTHMRVHTG